MTVTTTKVAILGGGPAGLTAAIYASRAMLEPIVIEGASAGGQLMTTTDIENYPGFAEGIAGPTLMEEKRKQAARFGTRFVSENAETVLLNQSPIVIKTETQEIHADTLIICTGARSRMLGLAAETRLMGHGVSVCATCDGFFFKGKDVLIQGGGDAALEEAIFLTRFAKSVTVMHRRDKFRASQIMVDKARKNPKIKFIMDSVLTDILNKDSVTVNGVRYKNVNTGVETELAVEGVFIAIGHEPNTSLFKDRLQLTAEGYIITDETKTNIPGVFAAGDVQDKKYRQAITAAGTGCQAALEAQWYLEALELASEDVAEPVQATVVGVIANAPVTAPADGSVDAVSADNSAAALAGQSDQMSK
jgi:thioredoxin-disulfide reductase